MCAVCFHPDVTFEEDMMSQRFTLFYAGFTAYAPALYFSELEFIEFCKNEKDEVLSEYISKFSDTLQDKYYESNAHLKTAISVAEHLDIDIQKHPQSFEEYFNWVSHYTECFEREFPMARIDHYYFLFARKISEILNNLGLLKIYTDLKISHESSPDLSKKMEKCLKDIEYILFKLMAAAALLSSEPRQNYFNVFYRSICQEFHAFKGIDLNDLQEPQLKQLKKMVEDYNLHVMDGFKNCISMLKELGI
ncbi:hypothetical protein CNR22_19920 [Sphingobacteriaceae bacterium]|nr:hypothetical protein CNR22_19920 [Sphingobacteriaceae bacterium]